jgi:hypothetical protein
LQIHAEDRRTCNVGQNLAHVFLSSLIVAADGGGTIAEYSQSQPVSTPESCHGTSGGLSCIIGAEGMAEVFTDE